MRRATLLAFLLLAPVLVAAAEAPPEDLPERYRRWLRQVELLLTEEEREYFLTLAADFRRDAFIDQFWRVRDPDPDTARNEFKVAWLARVDQALEDFGTLEDDRARTFILNGEPGGFVLVDGRELGRCYHKELTVELWFYGGSERSTERFGLVFFKPEFPRDAPYRIWKADEPLRPGRQVRLPTTVLRDLCAGEFLGGLTEHIREDLLHYLDLLDRVLGIPEPSSEEWVSTFASRTTELPAGVPTFDLVLAVEFPGRNQQRTAVQAVATVPAGVADRLEVGGTLLHEFLVLGEIVRDGALFETFRYRFEVPAESDAEVPLIFQRYLRPGAVRLMVRVEDLYGQRFGRAEVELDVPTPDGLASLRPLPDSVHFRLLAEANEAAARGQTTIRIVPPPDGKIHVGAVRFTTVTAGEVDRVEFLLDGEPLLTKRQPPYSVELNLGETAASHRLRAVARGTDGAEVASDELLVNQGGQRFRVRLTEPRPEHTYESSLSAVAQVEIPDGAELDRVEIFLDEQRKATLYQPPFVQALLLERPGLAYVRAVGYLTDGNSTEDVVFINTPEYFEQIEVQYVELYASVLDRRGRPVLGLAEEDFAVFEDGAEQEVRRFEFVRDLPIHAGLLIDSSASMEENLPSVADAARTFVEQTIKPRDRAALFSFNLRTDVEVKFTSDVEVVSKALTGLRAGGGTALYDSLVFALHYFDGVKGQKALLLLSDGKDESSRFAMEGAIEAAQRVGVTVYVIGLREVARDKAARKVLRAVADQTGGQAYFIEDLSELAAIYDAIQEELRSQYLLAYQSTSAKGEGELRQVRVVVEASDAEVRTISGYYP